MKQISIQAKEHDQCSLFSWSTFPELRGYLKYHSFCLPLQLLWKELIPWEDNPRTIKIWFRQSRGKSYPDIKLIHKMLTDSLLSITGVNSWIYTRIFDMMLFFCTVQELTWCQFFASSVCKSFRVSSIIDSVCQVIILLYHPHFASDSQNRTTK